MHYSLVKEKAKPSSEGFVMRKMRNIVFTATVMTVSTFGASSLFAQENVQNEEDQQDSMMQEGGGMQGNMMQEGGGMQGNMMGMMKQMNSMMEKCNDMMEKQKNDTSA